MPSEYNPQLVDNMSAKFRRLNNPAHAMADAIGMLKMFPGIRGIWSGAAVGALGQARDEINGLHLTNNNDAQFGYKSGTLVPRILYNGSTQYHSRTDEAALDITGTEAYINQNGLTIGAWVQFDVAAAAVEMIVSKWAAPSNLSYNINRQASGVLRFSITNDGSTAVNVDTVATIAQDTQYFVCGRFTPSTEIMARINGTFVTNTTSIPASIFSGSGNFELAANGGGSNLMDGRITLAFLCAAAVSDAHLDTFFQFTAPLFGVTV